MIPPEAPFDEPWQAQAFGLAVALSEGGLFTWAEWTQAFGARLSCGGNYWDAWVQTLEGMMTERGIAGPEDVARLTHAWQDAAHATPHGVAIRLEEGV